MCGCDGDEGLGDDDVNEESRREPKEVGVGVLYIHEILLRLDEIE